MEASEDTGASTAMHVEEDNAGSAAGSLSSGSVEPGPSQGQEGGGEKRRETGDGWCSMSDWQPGEGAFVDMTESGEGMGLGWLEEYMPGGGNEYLMGGVYDYVI
ncbi:hypothetical protein GUITHDRAFT_138389 [Guillardia theta CCMP2712]|uniref:Uncharacterized protein n=1 Tax=Guillardia theta (strain CCMP2712) TaxID=905079 RepID=L1JCP5_GUITC|nr:hypothetical protein GUITHDRAFT_138389 [Guillardia theta CCMP2712]EKX46293.1 hypothetical protein GUITHDRAFT_138389 [Guillardia theta CCMP2712]|eukprot:XP_005833273.1 hypothetical protein GUITHDRAFT_138389 [Guillardia theta CCMP2712]